MMVDKRFGNPVTIELDASGERRTVSSVREAADCLMEAWPAAHRGPAHRDALDTCLKVIDGHRSVIDAERAFVEAAWEARVFVSDLEPSE